MARVRGLTDGLAVYRGWRNDPSLYAALRGSFTWPPGDDRANGYLYAAGSQDWPAGLRAAGPDLLAALDGLTGVRFTIALYQGYRNGSGCPWHADDPFDVQAILSLGVTRTFGIRPAGGEPEWMPVSQGDLVFMPSGWQSQWQHCVPAEDDVRGERCALVFRTPRTPRP